jgi:C-terminal processing protease CtpA/Prc
MVTWTGTKVLKHDGSRLHGVGIRPTVPVTQSRAAIAAGRDEFLEKALEIVKK